MPEYLSPGVYIEEISTGPKPIEGVGTSTAGFLGMTERGPETPKLVSGWLEFQRWFGGYLGGDSFLPFAVQGFFDNGGQRCFIGRVVPTGSGDARLTHGALVFSANGRGAWGSRVLVKIDNGTQAEDDTSVFRVSIIYYTSLPDTYPGDFVDPLDPREATNPARVGPDHTEVYDNLTFEAGAGNNAVTVINAASQLVKCWWGGGGANAARPANRAFADGPLEGGSDGEGQLVSADFEGAEGPVGGITLPDQDPPLNEPLGRDTGLVAMGKVDEVAILLAPDEVRFDPSEVTGRIINQCEELRDRFALVSVQQGESDVSQLRPPQDTTYGAFYYPWIEIFDPAANQPRLVPPTGHVAGILARTDIERGVHKAPANAVVRNARGLEFPVTKAMQDMLNPRGVNCIRDFRSDGRGIRLWGARTMSSDAEWKYVNVRRLFIFVEESIEEATQWVVFEPNHEPTWARVVRSITNFLIRIWREGALRGLTQEEAFFVKCDRTTMTQDDIDNGRLICYIGLAPVKPAEFVIFRISQKTLEAQG